jgi:hypothetical protein
MAISLSMCPSDFLWQGILPFDRGEELPEGPAKKFVYRALQKALGGGVGRQGSSLEVR